MGAHCRLAPPNEQEPLYSYLAELTQRTQDPRRRRPTDERASRPRNHGLLDGRQRLKVPAIPARLCSDPG